MIPGMEAARVAVVGAGPSGIFAAQALCAKDPDVLVHVYDRLPTPYGLLRYGVAPDHTSMKGIQAALARVFDERRVSFIGHVELGTDIARADLLAAYDAVVYAAGASEDRQLRVPGEDLPGSRSARDLVAWYSGHPDAEPQSLAGVTTAVTVGVGNVAVDVARILLRTPRELAPTDMPQAVLDELALSRITDVWIVGRRGPQHASFTTVELRELLTLPGIQPIVHDGALDGIDEAALDRRTRANVAALKDAAAASVPDARARLHLLFWHRPLRIEGGDRVRRLVLEGTAVDDEGDVVPADGQVVIDCELVLRAIGYRGQPLPGVPFDERRGIIPNVAGRVTDGQGAAQPGEYVVGWIKRGPIGVIGTNKSDAAETITNLLADLHGTPRTVARHSPEELWRLRGLRPTTFADWERISLAEEARGVEEGRDRSKIAAWAELLDIARMGQAGGPPTPGDRQ